MTNTKNRRKRKFSFKEIHKLLIKETAEFGDSIWESLSFDFNNEQVEKYSAWMVKKGYITQTQSDSWFNILKQVYDGENDEALDEYTNIEAMTFVSTEFFPVEVYDHFEVPDLENYEVDLKAAGEKGLHNVPFIMDQEDPDSYNEMYFNNVLYVISEFICENQEYYSNVLEEFAT